MQNSRALKASTQEFALCRSTPKPLTVNTGGSLGLTGTMVAEVAMVAVLLEVSGVDMTLDAIARLSTFGVGRVLSMVMRKTNRAMFDDRGSRFGVKGIANRIGEHVGADDQ